MDPFIYQYSLGGLLFAVGMVYAAKQGYVGLRGPGLRNLCIMLGGLDGDPDSLCTILSSALKNFVEFLRVEIKDTGRFGLWVLVRGPRPIEFPIPRHFPDTRLQSAILSERPA